MSTTTMNRIFSRCNVIMCMSCGVEADKLIGDEQVRALGDALKTNTTLTELWLLSEQKRERLQGSTAREQDKLDCMRFWKACNFGVEGARALGDALKTNTGLIKLDLQGEHQDHNEAQSQLNSWQNGVLETSGLVMKERVRWVMRSRQAQL